MEKPGAAGGWTEIVAESSTGLLFYMADHPELDAELDAWGRGEELPAEQRARVEALVRGAFSEGLRRYFEARWNLP